MKTLPLYPERLSTPLETGPRLEGNRECQRCSQCTTAQAICLPAESSTVGSAASGVQATLLVIDAAPTSAEARSNRPFVSQRGQVVRRLVSTSWIGDVVYDYAQKCTGKYDEDAAAACSPYMRDVFAIANPDRVVLIGPDAARAALGRYIPPLDTRKAYSWLKRPDGVLIPVFTVLEPLEPGNDNKFIRKFMEEDFAWACTVPVSELMQPLDDAVFHIVETVEDAIEAVDVLRAHDWVAFDCETAGIMFSDYFEIKSLSLTPAGADIAYVWGRGAMANQATVKILLELLSDPSMGTVGANWKYDALSVKVAFGVSMRETFALDVQLTRSLQLPGCLKSLEVMSELVGMGGYKQDFEVLLRATRKSVAAARKRSSQNKQLSLMQEDPVLVAAMANPDADKDAFAYGLIQSPDLERYNARDTIATRRGAISKVGFVGGFEMLRASKPANNIWRNVVRNLPTAYTQIEAWGIAADRAAIQRFNAYITEKARVSAQRFESLGINPESPKQKSEYLFNKLKLRNPKDPKSRSTDKKSLKLMKDQHPIVLELIEHSRLAKLAGAYGNLDRFIRSDGRIHPSNRLDGTACMPAGELVLTARGYLPVERVRVDDQVISHTGAPRAVIGCVTNEPSHIRRVDLASGLKLRTTLNHEYMTQRGWVRADALVLGDMVSVHAAPEEWREIAGWPDFIVSSWGRVHNRKTWRDATQRPKGRWGHLKVCLWRDGAQRRGPDRKDFAVHRLVAKAFATGRTEAKCEVRHINGIAWDNAVGNLVWGTCQENRDDAARHGTMRRTEAQRKLSDADIASIRTATETCLVVARRFGVCRELIGHIRRGERRAIREITPPGATFTFSAVAAIIDEPSPATTYGLTVDVDHSHVTGGIVTHNTGRLSMSDPGLHQIPREEDGDGHTEGRMIKECFIAPPGRVLLALDQSQVEYRCAAAISHDDVMRSMFLNGDDFHMNTARLIAPMYWKIDPSAVAKAHRSEAKTFSFSLLYGVGDKTIASNLGISLQRAQELRAAIMGKWSSLAAWIAEQIRIAERYGYTASVWHGELARIRWLVAAGNLGNSDAASGARHTAINGSFNSPIQGWASDIVQSAVCKLVDWTLRSNIDAKLVLTVHDSIMFDVNENCWEQVRDHARGVMVDYDLWGVPLIADSESGPNWGRMKKA